MIKTQMKKIYHCNNKVSTQTYLTDNLNRSYENLEWILSIKFEELRREQSGKDQIIINI